MGDGEGEIHSPASGSRPVKRNQANYRITEADKIGAGSIREKCRNNLEAIRLLHLLRAENRPATDAEKSRLVKYVGWGGIPQIFSPASDWQAENQQLSSLLTDEEFRFARASTLNAHYTSDKIIRAMYAALERFGFQDGRILEPACGIGHFIGFMPEQFHAQSIITGIEIDPLTAEIAKRLYPDADIRNQPFENAALADSYFDLAISNIPFGDYKPYDTRFNGHGFLIHDYFFAAALEKVRPGGLVVFITSKGTMDKQDSALRSYLAQRADLVGAIRLPNDAFKRNANTEVTADILFLKRVAPDERPRAPVWKNTAPITNSLGEVIHINEYFAERPQMMLGEMRLEGRMYQRNEPTLVRNGRNIAEALGEAIEHLPASIYRPLKREVKASPKDHSRAGRR